MNAPPLYLIKDLPLPACEDLDRSVMDLASHEGAVHGAVKKFGGSNVYKVKLGR